MAVTVSPERLFGKNVKSWTVIATADADTTAVINHDFAEAPELVVIVPLVQATAAISLWAHTATSGTQITLTKSAGVGSGGVGSQIKCIAFQRLASVLG